MKRNMDLVRQLLFRFEKQEGPLPIEGFTEREILYHCLLLSQAGLIDADFIRTNMGGKLPVAVREVFLTWSGQEFLIAARNDTVWSKVSDQLIKRGVPATFEVRKVMLIAEFHKITGL